MSAKRFSLITVMILVGSFLLIGPTAALAQEKTTLKFWQFGGLLPEIEHFKEMTKEFNRTHPSINVVHAGQEWSTRRQKMLTSFVAEVSPDIFIQMSSAIAEYVRLGMLTPLDEMFLNDIADMRERMV